MTSRTTGGTTATLSYSVLDELVAWNAGSSSQEWYAYDFAGNRVVRRSTTGKGKSDGYQLESTASRKFSGRGLVIWLANQAEHQILSFAHK